MKKILCIGEALIDMICTDKGKSLLEGQNFLKKTGGAPTNVAAAIAALGGKVELAAKVGNDPFGHQLIEAMKDFGVSTQWMLSDARYFTTFAFVSLMENGERDFVFNRGADGELNWDEIKEINIKDFSIVHFGSATGFLEGKLQTAYKNLLEKSLETEVFVSFDPNYRHLLFPKNTASFVEQSWYFLERCHFFKVSDEEAFLLTNTNTLEEAAEVFFQKTKAIFTITLGGEGTLLGLNGKVIIIKSISIKPTDTTGAGDAFVGAVLYQLSQKSLSEIQQLSEEDWQSIIFNANKAGARTCEYVGAMEAFKYLNNQIFN
jgi:fructokinase